MQPEVAMSDILGAQAVEYSLSSSFRVILDVETFRCIRVAYVSTCTIHRFDWFTCLLGGQKCPLNWGCSRQQEASRIKVLALRGPLSPSDYRINTFC